MVRSLPYLLVLMLSAPQMGLAEEHEEAPSPFSSIEDLDYLGSTPLPGELGGQYDRSPDERLERLFGKTVTEVTAIDPPAGFHPVEDADITLGVPLSAALVRSAVVRLWDTGSYRDVQILVRPHAKGGVALLIEVKQMLRIRKLEVKGNAALDDDEVARAIEYTPDRTIQPDPKVLRELKQRLLSVYAEKGYLEAHAALRIETTKEPGGVALVVEVVEGKPMRYSSIQIPGMPDDLSVEYYARQAGLKKGTVREKAKVEKGMVKLVEHLSDAGYRDVRVKDFQERRIDQHNIELIIPLESGKRTEINFYGNEHVRTRDLLKTLVGEAVFRTTPDSLAQGLIRLLNTYQKKGFLHVSILATRICIDTNAMEKEIPGNRVCQKDIASQKLEIAIVEGPTVEVAHVFFRGNKYFDGENLEQELFAFMKEQYKQESLFQEMTTETMDDLGISDNRPEGLGRSRGLKSPRRNQGRLYVPTLYREAMTHLADMYQEQGFLQAKVTDTCPVKRLKRMTYRNMRFLPLLVSRDGDESYGDMNKLGLPCVMINERKDQLLVLVKVKEGPQTLFSEISFENNTVFPARALQKQAELFVSDPYNEYRLRESAKKLELLYRGRGYMFAKVSWVNSFSSDMQRSKVVFTVKEGPRVRIGRIRVEGAEMTSKKLILERLVFEPGEILTPDKIEESQQRLTELGILDSATIQMVSPEIPARTKNIKVQVTEGKPQYMELRGGLATVEGLRGGFEYGYRNLAGWALNARLRIRANYRLFFFGHPVFQEHYEKLDLLEKLEHHLLAGLGQPHFPGTKGLLGWNFDAIRERMNEPSFSATRHTGFLRLMTTHAIGKVYRRAVTIEARTGLEDNNITVLAREIVTDEGADSKRMINPIYQTYLRMPDGESQFWVTGLQLIIDLRDHPFNPRKGIYFSIGGDLVQSLAGYAPEYLVAATGEEENNPTNLEQRLDSGEIVKIDRRSKLIRAQATLSGYIPFGDTEMVLALSLSAGYIFHLDKDSTTWADRFFYAGGVDTLRGFYEESLVPEDIYQHWKGNLRDYSEELEAMLLSTGGEAMFIARAEFRYPMIKGFYGTVFAEAGNLWREQEKMDLIDSSPFRINLRPVVGGGLRYVTPIGPLSFDLGINLNRRPHEEALAWYFSIGSTF